MLKIVLAGLGTTILALGLIISPIAQYQAAGVFTGEKSKAQYVKGQLTAALEIKNPMELRIEHL